MAKSRNKWLTFSVITAVLITLLDIAELSHKTNILIYGIHSISTGIAGSIAFAFIIYWLLCTCVLMPIVRFSRLNPNGLDIGLAVFLVIAHIFYIIHRHIKFGHILSDMRLAALVIAAVTISLVISAIVINLLKHGQQKTWTKHLQKLGLYMSFIFLFVILVISFISDYDRSSTTQAKQAVQLPGAPKHVILIVIDTLRADAISSINSNTMSTPNIDALADDGILFNNALSTSPWTTPSVASILTGLSPLAHRTMTVKSKLPDECFTITEYFDQQNYQTAGFAQNAMLINKNFEQGFDIFKHQKFSKVLFLHQKLLWKFRKNKDEIFTRPKWITDQAIEWLDDNIKQHTFLYIHYLDPHHPYRPIDRYLPKGNVPKKIGESFSSFRSVRSGHLVLTQPEKIWVNSLYKAELANVDDNIGTIINHLKNKGIYDKALIVLTSDHGEEFWEHDNIEHGHTLYNELLHVPLIIKMPSQTSKRIIDSKVTINSIVPTVLDICNIEYEPKAFSAPSLAPAIINDKKIPPINIVSTGLLYYENRIAAEFDDFKYIEHLDDGTQELYNLKDDPHELINIAKDNGDIINIAKKIIAEDQKKANELRQEYNLKEPQTVDIDEKTLEMLRGLGYVQ